MIDHLRHKASLEAELEEMLVELDEDDVAAWDAFAEDWVRRAAEYCIEEHDSMWEFSSLYICAWTQTTENLPPLVRAAWNLRSDPVVSKMLNGIKLAHFG